MKSIKALMSVVFLSGALGGSGVSARAEDVIFKNVLNRSRVCPATEEIYI